MGRDDLDWPAHDGADPATIKFVEGNAATPTPDTTPEKTALFIKDELAKWAPIIRKANVKIA